MSDLLPLVADALGFAKTEFLGMTAVQWADREMLRRYRQGPPASSDRPKSVAVRCYQFLMAEHNLIRSWIQDSNQISLLMLSRTVGEQLNRPLGEGIVWDFDRGGSFNSRVLQFKGTLVALERATSLYNPHQTSTGSYDLLFSGIARQLRQVYQDLAESHPWIAQEKREGGTVVSLSGADQAKRWVVYRVHHFLLSLGAEPDWSWDASGCRKVFGAIEGDARSL